MDEERLGTDLNVLPHMMAHDAAQIDLVRRRSPGPAEVFDVDTVRGRENLAQALVLRLLTPRGALAGLGHAAYGSQLHKLIGQRKTEALRNLCRAYVLEVVAQEARVEKSAVSLVFDRAAETVSSFVFTLEVQPCFGGEPLDLSLEVGL
jgi:phage baseplate assembly protein W